MWLNLGCGERSETDCLNIDIRPLKGVELVADVRYLHFKVESVERIFLLELLEHLTYQEAKQVLTNCFTWLKPEGNLIIATPNLVHITHRLCLTKNTEEEHESLKWLFGSDGSGVAGYSENFHKWIYSFTSLETLLNDIGFRIVNFKFDCGGYRMLVEAGK